MRLKSLRNNHQHKLQPPSQSQVSTRNEGMNKTASGNLIIIDGKVHSVSNSPDFDSQYAADSPLNKRVFKVEQVGRTFSRDYDVLNGSKKMRLFS